MILAIGFVSSLEFREGVMLVRRAIIVLVGCCFTVGAIGCSGGNFGTVRGTVKHKGNPVDGAKVEFHGTTEKEGGARDIFVTQTDSSGRYYIAGLGKDPGIPPGMYKVAISKYEGKTPLGGPDSGMDRGQLEAQMSDLGASAPVMKTIKNHLPDMYASPDSSKLSTIVEVGKNENVDFNLE